MSTGRARSDVVVLAVLAGLLNVNFLAERLLAHPTPVASTVISDLASPGRPWSWVFRLGDLLSGLLLLVLCVVAWRSTRPPVSRAWRPAVAALALFAASTVVAVLVPERCAASTDPGCSGVLGSGQVADAVHDLVSTLGTTSGLLAALGLAVATRRTRPQALAHLTAFVVGGALGVVFLVQQSTGSNDGVGWVQRAQVVVLSVWFVAVGWSAAEPARAPTMPT